MRIAVLSRSTGLYSTSRLLLAGRARGHRVEVIDPLELQLTMGVRGPKVRFAGRPIPRYDLFIPRIGASVTRYGVAVLRALGERATVINGADAIDRARDKIRALGSLANGRLRVPRTVTLRGGLGVDEAIELVGGPPLVVKLAQGTQGVGTMMAETHRAACAMLDTFAAMGHPVILQAFVSEAAGSDLRCFVVGDRVVAAMRRRARGDEFRSNLHRGGKGQAVVLTRAQRSAALRAARVLDLTVAGVDLLESDAGPVVLEVNCSPGLEGIEEVTGVDIADAIIAHGEELVG